jgi:PKD repeat protein
MSCLLRGWLLCILSGWWSILAAVGQCLPSATCTPGSALPNSLGLGAGIFRVQLTTLDTITNGASDGFQDYSCRRAAQLGRGTTYTLRVTTGATVDEQVRAWADFNQDGVFDLLTEQILTSTGRQHAGAFTVPASVPVGANLRLRIAADYIYSPLPGSCTTPQYSQTEDYRVVITATPLPSPQAAFSAVDSVSCGAAIQLRDHTRNAPTNWRWDFGDGTRSTQQHPTHTYAAAGIYAVRLRVCNTSGCDSLTKSAYILVRADGPRATPCQPATQAYCCQYGLDRVRLAGLDHRPGGGAAGYQDASCAHRATLRADWPDTLRLTTGGIGTHDVRVYLDLNDDGQFTPATELLYQGLSVKSPAIVVRISSLTASLVYNKALRLRICTDYSGSPAVGPCAPPQWGQVADYSVLVLPNTLVPQTAFRLHYTQACGPVTVDFQNTSIGSASYQWNFGDGTTSTASAPPTHTYAVPGIYSVQLVAHSPAYTDTTTRQVVVAAACPTYCTAAGLGGSASTPVYFTRVQLVDLDNTDLRSYGMGYRDFTARSTELQQGQAYTLRAESLPWYFAGSGPWMRVTAWIDYNQDGNFAKTERLGQVLTLSPHLLPFQVPTSAAVGATRLRVQIAYATAPSDATTSCTPSYQNVATEDYTVLVLPANRAPQVGFAASLPTTCNATVQFRDTSSYAPTAWQWSFGDGANSSLPNPSHTYAQLGTYTVSLQASNSFGSQTVTETSYVTVQGMAQGPRPAACLPTPGPALDPSYDWHPTMLTIGSWSYTNSSRLTAYLDETCATSPVQWQAGTTQSITFHRPSAMYGLVIHCIAWLDANDDGVFDPVAERLYSSPVGVGGVTWTIPFSVPTMALTNRPLRLRVWWMGAGGNLYVPEDRPCYRHEDLGQVRDFTAVISTPLATTAQISNRSWQAYPNPTTGVLRIHTATSATTTAQVYNSSGQLVWSNPIHLSASTDTTLDLHSLPAGIYLIRLLNDKQVQRLVLLP